MEHQHLFIMANIAQFLHRMSWFIVLMLVLMRKFASAPHEAHMTVLKNILRYLKGTLDLALFYPFGDDQPLVSFADSDYGGCRDTRRSTSGIIHKLREVAIDWRSKRQPNVALSTTEA